MRGFLEMYADGQFFDILREMRKVLRESFFDRDTKIVAKDLLGNFLVRKVKGREVAVMITETEAYDGPNDLASHASKGRTKRTKIMFGEPGKLYIYLCYGMHYMLNVVTREKDYPAAVLIRGAVYKNSILDGLAPLEIVRARPIPVRYGAGSVKFLMGPGKLTKFLRIDKRLNGKMASKESGLWFENRNSNLKNQNSKLQFKIQKLSRVGVNYAGPIWSKRKLRFKLVSSK